MQSTKSFRNKKFKLINIHEKFIGKLGTGKDFLLLEK